MYYIFIYTSIIVIDAKMYKHLTDEINFVSENEPL